MAVEKFSSKDAVVAMVQHYETLLVATKHLQSEHPFVREGLALVAEVKLHFGNRCFLTTTVLDELDRRQLLSWDKIEDEEDEDGGP